MSTPQNKIKTISEINTDELLETIMFYHQFYDDLEDDLIQAIKDLQNFWLNNQSKEFHEDLLDKDIKKIWPYWNENQHIFNEASEKVSKAVAVIPQVVNDIRKDLYPFEQLDSLINVPKTPEPQVPKSGLFGIKNPWKKKNFDPNSPYRLSNKRTKFLEKIEDKWQLINEYQTKGTSTWSEYILDESGQQDYRDLVLDVFNYFIATPLSSIFHYGLWLNLANEKNLSRDIMMVGMQQTLRKEQESPMPSTPTIQSPPG